MITVTRENYSKVREALNTESRQLRASIKELSGYIIMNLTNEELAEEVARATEELHAHQKKLEKNKKLLSDLCLSFKTNKVRSKKIRYTM